MLLAKDLQIYSSNLLIQGAELYLSTRPHLYHRNEVLVKFQELGVFKLPLGLH